jgi:hypothetical protein
VNHDFIILVSYSGFQFFFLQGCLVCSCAYFSRHGRPCRHIYCILQRPPRPTDCNIKQFKLFEAFYGRDENVSSIMAQAMQSNISGPVVGDQWTLEPNSREYHDLAWFMEAKEKVITRPGIVSYGGPAVAHGALTTITNCYDSPDDTNVYTNDDDDDDDNDESNNNESLGIVKDAFQSLAPVMSRLYGLVEDESDLSMATNAINNVIEKLLEKKRAKVNTGGGRATIFSLPETDNRKKDTRKRPAASPLKK